MIVLDTHALVWWLAGGPLSEPAREAIARQAAKRAVYASSMTAWEIAVLVRAGRLELTIDVADWLTRAEAVDSLHFVPVDNRIALAATRLPEPFHRDPADRLIVATARVLEAPLVTRDARLASYSGVETIW